MSQETQAKLRAMGLYSLCLGSYGCNVAMTEILKEQLKGRTIFVLSLSAIHFHDDLLEPPRDRNMSRWKLFTSWWTESSVKERLRTSKTFKAMPPVTHFLQ